MSTILDNRYKINGVISTDKSVLQNIEILCNGAATWLTYDVELGKWAFIINRASDSVASFDDTNIIGSISMTGSGLTELYNSVRVEFPHVDLRDQRDYIKIEIPTEDRNANEPNNTLNIQYDIFNDPVQAELLGLIELKQSRVDKIIRFSTDFSELGLKAGDVIDVTNTIYGFNQKLFRIVNITESDEEDGSITLGITALEYDADVYSTDDLSRFVRTTSTGIAALGAIGTPGTPQVTKFEKDSRPRILVESTAPTGTVEGMELWYTTDVPPTVTLEENRRYKLWSTVMAPTGTVFAFGDEVEFDVDNTNAGNFLVKTRGINASTAGPFSDSAGFVYTPVQVTDAVGPDTGILDNAASPIAGLLAANALMALLGELFNGSAAGTGGGFGGLGSIFKKVFDIFEDETGVDITSPEVTGGLDAIAKSNGKLQISASAGKITTPSLSPGSGILHTLTFVADVSGSYKIDVILDQNTSGARGGRGSLFGEVNDLVSAGFEMKIGSSSGTMIATSGSGSTGAFFWTDFVVTNTMSLTAGQTYYLEFYYNVSTESNPSATHNWDVSWNVYSLVVA